MIEKIHLYVYRFMYSITLLILSLAILERVLRTFGYTFSFMNYEPGKLLQLGAIFAIFTCMMLLRQIKNRTADKV